MTATDLPVKRRVVVPYERLVSSVDDRVLKWWHSRFVEGVTPLTYVTDHEDFQGHARVYVTDDPGLAAVLAALASDGPAAAERVMALFDDAMVPGGRPETTP